jgi:hypothetical protein
MNPRALDHRETGSNGLIPALIVALSLAAGRAGE